MAPKAESKESIANQVEPKAYMPATGFPSANFAVCAVSIYNDFQTTLARIQTEEIQSEDAARASYAKTVWSAQRDGFKEAREAYLEYAIVFHRAQVNPEETSNAEVFRAEMRYLESHQQAVLATQETMNDAGRACTRDIQAIRENARDAWAVAYGAYVQEIRDIFAGADPLAIDPATLASVAQSMMLAVVSANSVGAARVRVA